MCGIIGVIHGQASGYSSSLCNYLKQGIVTGIVRGEDSTGMFQMNNERNIRILRSTMDGYELSQTKKAQAMLNCTDTTLATFIHHRKATQGAINYENCHPFEHEDDKQYVVGIHNGSLYHWNKKEDGLAFDVDSDWLYYQILKEGPAKAIGEACGAYALVWMQKNEVSEAGPASTKIYLAANEERELHWAMVKDTNQMLVASEAAMLFWLAARNKLRIEQIYKPDPKSYYVFDPENLRAVQKFPLEIPLVKVSWSQTSPTQTSSGGFVQDTRGDTKPRSKYDPVTKGNVYENENEKYTDFFGPDALKGFLPFHISQEVDFSYKTTHIIAGVKESVDVEGEVMHENAEAYNAMAMWLTRDMADNVAASKECLCKVIGRRDRFDKKTGKTTTYVLVGHPFVVMLDEDAKAPSTSPSSSWLDAARKAWEHVTILANEEDDSTAGDCMVKGPGGNEITSLRFRYMTRNGCGCCSDEISIGEADKIGWGPGDEPICEQCVKNLANSEILQ